ncbi:aspartate aminotransferase family protein [Sphingobacteriales bacterium UPWRP_1]|nr:aspartate aminotransferase family protein [Sphingobacteriales bacterium TSM_CSM]PSJ72481.1 aspartate aminotransferase family protein [Sphingobacteriales bacterium UPWRP_1]
MLTQRQLFLQHIAQTSNAPLLLEIERAEGIYLYDTSGKSYIDLISGISVSNLGHCHPEVVAAIQHQAARFMHLMVYGEYVFTPQVALAKLLTQHLPPQLNNVYFVNSGTEATEGALKLAKRYTGRTQMASFLNAYHGSTHGALSMMGSEVFKRNYRPLLPDVRNLRYNHLPDLQYITSQTACVLAEPIQAEAGVIAPQPGFMQALRQRCTETGALLILDEIQTGYGRTGSLFAFEQLGIVPDILLLAKGMGGGMPLGAFIAPHFIMEALTNNPVLGHITTFGGHPVSCAASLATLQILLRETYIQEVKHKEQLFRQYLQHPAIKDVRSFGLLIAVVFDNFATTKKVIDTCIANGIVTDWFLFADNCLRIAPPLLISPKQIKTACQLIAESIETATQA